jgi:hypothetical protein
VCHESLTAVTALDPFSVFGDSGKHVEGPAVMTNAPLPAGATLRWIRWSLLAGVLLIGLALWFVRGTTRLVVPEPWPAILVYLFAASVFATAFAVVLLRAAIERASSVVAKVRLCFVAYAIAETCAIVGALHLFFTGAPFLYLAGVAVFVIVLVLLRSPIDSA